MNIARQLLGAAILLAVAGNALAGSDNAFDTRNGVGSGDCWPYTDGARIIIQPDFPENLSSFTVNQMGTTAIAGLANGASVVVNGPDSSDDPDATPETATITRVNAETVAFSMSSADIYFAVLKSGDSVEVLYYQTGEVVTMSDSNMRIILEGQAPIDSVSLCYGSATQTAPPNPDPSIPQCTSCSGGDTALICGFKLDDPHFGGGTNECCVCGSPALQQCNPAAPAGEAGSCLGDPSKPKSGLNIPTLLEFNKDPYVCSIAGGKRTCYAY